MKWKYFFIIVSCILFGFILGFLVDIPQEYTIEIGEEMAKAVQTVDKIQETECPIRLDECRKICKIITDNLEFTNDSNKYYYNETIA